jgi:hypothetical protein
MQPTLTVKYKADLLDVLESTVNGIEVADLKESSVNAMEFVNVSWILSSIFLCVLLICLMDTFMKFLIISYGLVTFIFSLKFY